jgi:ubiquinone/menaquinone biosynthesis C-methylase UbiE
MFLRKAKRREPVPITMTGVRMGERVLQLGVDDPAVAGAIAAKAGLSGHAAALVTDADSDARMRAAATEAGVLIDIQSAPLDRMPLPDAGFDVVVVHSVNGRLADLDATVRGAVLRECWRVLRQGGRIVTIESGTRRGMAALLSRPHVNAEYAAGGGTAAALERAGFHPVRIVGDVEGLLFTEGLRK